MTIVSSRPVASSSVSSPSTLQLTCKQWDLARGLSIVSRAVLSQSTQPILSAILLESDHGRLRLSATNLEIGIQVWVDAQIASEGMIAMPADLFTRMVGLMPKESMTLSGSKGEGAVSMKMESGGSVSHLRSPHDPVQFPLIPTVSPESLASWVIDARLLKQMIEQVAFAAADPKKESTLVLSAVLVKGEVETLTMAAADRLLVAERKATLLTAGEPFSPILVPAQSLIELARILPSGGKVQLAVMSNQMGFHYDAGDDRGERITFVSRLVSGNYPPYERAIPPLFPTRAVVATRILEAAVERASLVASTRDAYQIARVTLRADSESTSSGVIAVEAEDADRGDHQSRIPAQVTGPECQLIFLVRLLLEALTHIEAVEVVLGALGPGMPVVLRPVSEEHYTSVIMTALPSRERSAEQAGERQ